MIERIKEIGEFIRSERERLKLTQLELAEYSGCGITFINQLERGKSTVRLDKCMHVLRALGISVTFAKGSTSMEIKAK